MWKLMRNLLLCAAVLNLGWCVRDISPLNRKQANKGN